MKEARKDGWKMKEARKMKEGWIEGEGSKEDDGRMDG